MSDLARVYPAGTEPAKGGQSGGVPYPSGQEKGSLANQHNGHAYGDLAK